MNEPCGISFGCGKVLSGSYEASWLPHCAGGAVLDGADGLADGVSATGSGVAS
jgi:hypothetical protein